MTVEELQLENEKLTARLQKAVQVFSDQKATIQRLTEERDRIAEERDQAVEKAKNAEDADDKFFEQITEIDNLKTKLNNALEENAKAVSALNDANNTLLLMDKKVEESEAKFKENENAIVELKERLSKAGNLFAEQKEIITSKDLEIEELKKQVNGLEAKLNTAIGDLDVQRLKATSIQEQYDEIGPKYRSLLESTQKKNQIIDSLKELVKSL